MRTDQDWRISSALRTMLAYKAMARRVWFEIVDEALSTRSCSECGALSGPKGIERGGIKGQYVIRGPSCMFELSGQALAAGP